MAALSSAVIIFSFVLLINARTVIPEKAKAALLSLSPNAVVVTESSAGKIITVAKVKLEAPGYVVVHEGKTGSPGAILGYSKLLPEGEEMDVVVGLASAVADGEALYAMLHLDNGDGKFDAKSDMPAKDNLGNPVMMRFVVGKSVEGALLISY